MSDSVRTSSEFLEYSEKLNTERKKRDLIDIKIRKVVETSPPLDLSEEKKRVDHWGTQIKSHNEGIDKKIANCQEVIVQARNRILLQEQLIQRYESIIAEAEAVKESKSTRPHYEHQKALQDLELKKNHKPKELQKLEIDLEVIDKKIESFLNLLGMSKIDKKKVALTTPTPSIPHTPSANPEKPKVMRGKKIVPVDNIQEPEPVERPATPVPEPIEFVTLPEPAPVVVPLPPPVAVSNEPRLILNTKVMRAKKSVAPS
jgi:hypothetical protein